MKKDIEIQKNVMDEIQSIPSVNASEIGVGVKNGIVTLSGIVTSYPQKIALERTVLKVRDVQGLAEGLQVKLNGYHKRADSEIAQAVMYSLEWHSGLDKDKIQIMVEKGEVTIEGQVDWDYQRKLAYKTVSNITGVTAVINNLKIANRPLPAEIKNQIQVAFSRNANIHSGNIQVSLNDHKVTLNGKVKSWAEKKEAEEAVWKMPGVTEVKNQLEYEEALDACEIH
jgi:osmotically-inducible protein OsmY